MNALNNYIKFLQAYKKLLEKGLINIFESSDFIWIDDIQKLIDEKLCETTLTELFIKECDSNKSRIFSLKKPLKPEINIPSEFSDKIEFNDVKNKFESKNENENDLITFKKSDVGIREIKKIQTFTSNKAIYSKLYRTYNDIINDSNIEIVLSVGLIQYSKQQGKGKIYSISKTNQHIFHFPLKIELQISNKIYLSFSDAKPYAEFFFLNKTPIEKTSLDNIIDRFEKEVDTNGFQYIYEDSFKKIISERLQQISGNSTFENSILKPISDTVNVDSFKFSFSPSINIKRQKPRFFDKLTKDIIDKNKNQENNAKLFNLLIKNPNNEATNSDKKQNYFTDELFEKHKENNSNLEENDFSVFFPLPYNKEQKEIYDNYLKNRLTVVTGPPGTGKSHTIVNILCTLLAQGKRVLVTAQTDKALESLLDKIPPVFDDLVFTKIQLEVDKTRFSLEKSIANINKILTKKFHLNVEKKISDLNTLKGDYSQFKIEIYRVLKEEYNKITLNDSFNGLRSYQLWDKLQSKKCENWNWLEDEISLEQIKDFSKLKSNIDEYIKLLDYENSNLKNVDIDLTSISDKINFFDFNNFLNSKNKIEELKKHLDINDDISKSKLLEIDLNSITQITKEYSNSDIVISSYSKINQLKNKIESPNKISEDYNSNLKYSEIVENASKYLRDIESYLVQIKDDKEKAGFLDRLWFKGKFKQIKYLERIVLNSKNCDNKTSLKHLRDYVKQIQKIDSELNKITKAGFDISIDEDSGLSDKSQVLDTVIEKVEKNYKLVCILQDNRDVINFSSIFNIEISNIEKIYDTSISYKEDIEELKKSENTVKDGLTLLKEISNPIAELHKSLNNFGEFIPLKNISETVIFEKFKTELKNTVLKINEEQQFNKCRCYLKEILPKTFYKLKEIPPEYITKENLEFAHANNYFSKNEIIDLQKTKEKLSQINNKIYKLKCKILFDLAKNNFKNNFNPDEIDEFINLLSEYEASSRYANRGIKDKVKFQKLVREHSKKISRKLSCWVMKFNDVLNSVGTDPEIFDCIIVDEASQLDFNSLILGYYAKNMIIVGDDKQTSPSALTGVSDNDFQSIKDKYLDFLGDYRTHIRSDNSLFTLSKMVAGSSNLALKEHFRCVSEIIKFSNSNFYDNSLKLLKQINTENRLKPIEAVFVEDSSREDKIVYKEIESIKNRLIEIIKNPSYQNKTIGVVSLGSAKHTEKLKDIKEGLSDVFGEDKLDKIKLIIENSPKFQGDERDVMLVSLGVALDSEKIESNDNPKPRAIVYDGILKDELKKINVALSRAKEQMILFHSVKSKNLRTKDFRLKIISFFNNKSEKLEPFDLPENETDRDLYNRPKPFDSWFEYDITRDLMDNGYPYIQPQYKVKEKELFYNHRLEKETYVNFKLDLVVINNGKRVAIECDGDPFHSSPEDVAHDVERQEFLERVGWKVYRILYSAYKRNPSDEIEKMVNFIEKNTKKDKTITLSEVNENEIIEEIPQRKPSFNDQSHIDKSENDIYPPEEELISESTENIKEDKILRYFNLNINGTYFLEQNKNPAVTFSIPIKESEKNGYLLQGYDNGHLNKVLISTLLSKRIDKEYKNGLNIRATLSFLKIIKADEIIALYFYENGIKKFKAHLTQNISNREQLQLQGYKVIYSDFTNLEYQILPFEIFEKIERLVYKSFTSSGKPIDNSNYEEEWEAIKINSISIENPTIQPKLFNKKIGLNSKVKLKFLDTSKEITVQIISGYQISSIINGIQSIRHESPLAVSIMNKENGDKIKIINTENIVEIIEILN